MVGSVLGVVLVVAVVIVISIAGGGKTVPRGCVDVTISGPIGGEELYRCGEEAVSLCASVGKANGFTGDPGRDVARACRKTGLPVG